MLQALLFLAISIPPGFTTYHNDVGPNQARFLWQAAAASATTCGYVEYGTSRTYDKRTLLPCPLPAFSTVDRAATVSDLLPGTTYYYRIRQCTTGTCPGAEETPTPEDATTTFTTPAAADITPIPPTRYEPIRPVVNGTSVTASSCSDIQVRVDALAALDTSLVHELIIPVAFNCYLPTGINLPSRAGTGWIIIRSSHAGGATFLPTGTRVEAAMPGLPILRCPGGSTSNGRCFRTTGTSQGWWLWGLDIGFTEPYAALTVTAMTQGVTSQCGAAADTWGITTATAHGLANNQIVVADVAGFSTPPKNLRVYSAPTSTTLVACGVGATLDGAFSSGTITSYDALAISSAVGAAGTVTVTTPSAHGMQSGTWITIQGVAGLNGSYSITRTGPTTFTITSAYASVYPGGARLSYGPGPAFAVLEWNEMTSRIVVEQSRIGCGWPNRCLYAAFSGGAQDFHIRDSYIERLGWYHRTSLTSPFGASDFIYQLGYSNNISGGSCLEPTSPGPVMLSNSSCVGSGILIFSQEYRADPVLFPSGPTGNLTVEFSEIRLDPRCDDSSPSFAGFACGHWHLFEIKAGRRMAIVGNTFVHRKLEESVAAGDWLEITPRCGTGSNPCRTSQNLVGDILIRNNNITSPGGIALYGSDQRHDGTLAPVARVMILNNVMRLRGRTLTSVTTGFGHVLRLWNVAGVTLESNSIVGRSEGNSAGILTNNYQRSYGVHARRNIFAHIHDFSKGGFGEGDISLVPLPALVTTMPGKFADQYPGGGWSQNIVVPQVLDSTTAANCYGSAAGGCNFDGAAYWGGFSGTTLVPGATADARIAAVGWRVDDRIAYTSAYAGYGAALDPIVDAAGAARVIGVSSGVATINVRWFAPSASACAVDRSNDGFVTFTRLTASGGARAQSVSFTGVASGTWTMRVHCRVTVSAPLGVTL